MSNPVQIQLDAFEADCVANVGLLAVVPSLLEAKGFKVTHKLAFESDDSITAICLEHPDLPYGFSYLMEAGGAVSSCAILIPETTKLRGQLIAFAESQEQAEEVTEHTLQFLAFAPDEVAWTLTDGRFWTSKPEGNVGRNFSVTDGLFKLRGNTPALALTVDRNLSLKDPMTDDEWESLVGSDSKLQACIDTFQKVGMACAPDVEALDRAAKMLDFNGPPAEDGAFSFGGGKGHRSTTISVNMDSDFEFEFALSFTLDERIPSEFVRQRLHFATGVGKTTKGGLMNYEGAWGPVDLRGDTYRVGCFCIRQLFGNHVFLLQK